MKQKAITMSVVIPAYNEEQLIQKTLASVFNQDVAGYEVIVVDNNSTDKTGQIAEKMGARVILEKKGGTTFARNTGFDNARGSIIARCDADTIVPPDWLKKINASLSPSSAVAVSGPADFYDPSLPRFFLRFFNVLQYIIYFKASRFVLGKNVLFGPNCAIKKAAWGLARGNVCTNDHLVHEDMDLGIHVGRYGDVVFNPTMVVKTSLRRLYKPWSLFVEYPYRWFLTIFVHLFHKEV